MTWHTPRGDRILTGPEAELFREALMIITDWIEGDVDQDQALHEFGIPAFDTATARGKLALLADVGYALLRQTDRCPKLLAVRESTIGAIFFAMEQSVQHEIDNEFELPDGMFWRQRILQAVRLIDSDLETPDADGCNWEEWEFLIDVLRDVILWDRDFDSESTFVDADPGVVEDIKIDMGIGEDYFCEVAPDPSDKELETIRLRLRSK
ncbi:MAG: hypothetical protein WKF77_27315 [Planctomycetaceae bacterium]